jgi:FKBP-type peptidyl-prolyl cis-trans isomerase FklB
MMKKSFVAVVSVALIVVFARCTQVPHAGDVVMKNSIDSISSALGFMQANQWAQMFGRSGFDSVDVKLVATAFAKNKLSQDFVDAMKQQFDGFNEEVFVTAFVNQMAFGKSNFDDMTASVYLQGEYQKISQKKDAERSAMATENLEKGKAFLDENGKRPEVVTLESGLQYEIITKGEGAIPTAADMVKVHYHGTTLDGKVFDSSVERGEPFTFNAGGGVIQGWLEAIKLMPVGSKWKLFIPSELAYGQAGSGNDIGPNSVLIFEVELLEIVQKPEAALAQ